MHNKNWNCDNDKCTHSDSEIRVLPTGGGGNALLCRACYLHEISWRKSRNLELNDSNAFSIPDWSTLKTYKVGS